MLSFSDNDQGDVLKQLPLLCLIYPTELKLIQAKSFDTEAPFSVFDLFITSGIVSSKYL